MVGKLEITPVETAAERREFIEFQWEVYRDDPYWVPPLLSEREEFLDPQRHPFHQHAKVRYFVARRDGKIVGRIAGIVNYAHNQHWNDKVGFFGLYEVLQDREASDALLETVESFLRDEGMDTARGPASFSTNEEVGLLVDGWDGPPRALMTYNPRYYVDYIEGYGYTKAMDLLAYMVDLRKLHGLADGSLPPEQAPEINPKVFRVTRKVQERMNITVRPMNMRDFDAEAARFKEIYNAAWAKNWGFVPLTEAELEHEIGALKAFIDPHTIFFAEKNGRPVGAMLPLPDLNQPLLKAYPRPGVPEWWTIAKLLYWWKIRRSVTIIRAYAGGVIEEYRGRGVDAVLFMETLLGSLRRGYKWGEISWVLENNTPMRQTAINFGGKLYRTYRLYDKKV